ncbi:hypothetical protein HMI56_004531 [Coelomomyces lativittatus]|nr:hypothetical protein HMI56_004531 [Coelomomyces lativittatus]
MTGVTLLLSQPWIDAALAGLLLSYSLVVTESMMWFIRSQAMVEMDMNSVERLCEWIEHIEQEPQLKKHPVLYGWPNKGVIRFNHLTVQYSPTLPTVLKDLTFTVQSGEKVGICGRTGAGKSSLAASIFRFVPWVHGSIMIDQVDISTLDLNDLRSKLTMVPQNPMLFRGTVRSNLDVFHEYSDPELESVLQRVHLNIGLDDIVRENGCNFSVGARQIISLARALLRRTRILILDEATSNVDSETDALIQNTIRSEFQNCTILTIAHRLKTIIDFDKVLVLDNGEVVQFDTPKTLLSQTDGVFYKMCLETGELDTLISLMKN